MADPLVSIIIPVGPRHVEHCRVAAASVAGQSLAPICETIVVADGGAAVAPMAGVTVLPSDGQRRGPAATRNRGIAVARGQWLLFLDADDYLLPRAVEQLLRGYASGRAGYVYGNTYTSEPWHLRDQLEGQPGVTVDPVRQTIAVFRSAPDYVQSTQAHYNLHVVTALVPTRHVRRVGGFDERVDAWEDWTLWLRLAIAGICGSRIPDPVFVYRVYEGDRMTHFWKDRSTMQPIWDLYRDTEGRIPMASCCGGDADLARLAGDIVGAAPDAAPLRVGTGLVRVEYIGPNRGAFTYDFAPGSAIRLGNNAIDKYADVTEAQYQWLKERLEGDIRLVSPFDAPTAPPAPLAIPEDAPALVADVPAVRPAAPDEPRLATPAELAQWRGEETQRQTDEALARQGLPRLKRARQ